MDRDAALALLESQHDFPGPFAFRVVVRPRDKELTVSAMSAAAGDDAYVVQVEEKFSRNGNYLALRVRIHVPTPERVLDVYAVLKEFEHVLATM